MKHYLLKFKVDWGFIKTHKPHNSIKMVNKKGYRLYNIRREDLIDLYTNQKKSTRKIAAILNIPKTTVGYYLEDFKIKRRTKSEAARERFKAGKNWCEGLSKNIDSRLKSASENISRAFKKKREKRIKEIELKFNMSIKEILKDLYWDKKMNKKDIAKLIGLDKKIVIELMKANEIKTRPNYEYIASLKGENHSMYGKKWEDLFGEEKAKNRKEATAKYFRELTIKRIKDRKFPFIDTKIEKLMASELKRRKIPFEAQYRVGKRFVCDFAIPSIKIAIECDGDFWHANPQLYERNNPSKLSKIQINKIEKDRLKKDYLINNGWTLLRFFELDINSNVSDCVDKIERKIKIPLDNI